MPEWDRFRRPSVVAPSGPRWDRIDTIALLAFAALFFASRGVWVVYFPSSAFYWEEAYRWIAVQELASGAPWSLADLQADHYQGGSQIVVGLALGLASLTGTGILTLKIVAIVLSFGTLCGLYLIGRRFFGRRVAMLAAAMHLCGPPLVAYWGVCLMGFHAEATLLGLMLAYATLALVTEVWRGALAWGWAGLLATLAVWFTPTAGVAVAACALTWLLLRGMPPRGAWLPVVAGALLGAVPWLAYNVSRGWVGVGRIVEVFSAAPSNDVFRTQDIWERAFELAWRVPSQGVLDPADVLGGSIVRSLLLFGVLVPVSLGFAMSLRRVFAWRSTRRPAHSDGRLEWLFWIHGLIFLVAYLASRFTLDFDATPIVFRLFVAPAVFLVVPLAVSAAEALRAPGPMRWAAATATGVLLVSMASATAMLAVEYEARGTPPDHALGYVTLGRLAQRKYPEPLGRAVQQVHAVPAGQKRAWVLFGIGWGITEYFEQGGSLETVRAFAAGLGEDDKAVLSGMRWGARWRLDHLLGLQAQGVASPDLERSILRMQEMRKRVAAPDEIPEQRGELPLLR